MICTDLILIEGLTGSGKSTLAQRPWLHLERLYAEGHGRPARWVYEHDAGHPIWRPGEQESLAAGPLDLGFLDTLAERWRALAGEGAGGVTRRVTILDGALFQSTLGFLLAMGVPPAAIRGHVEAVAAILAPLAPSLIHLDRPDIAAALRATFSDRADCAYEADLTARIAATPYGRAAGLADRAGLVRFYEAWRGLVVDAAGVLAACPPWRSLVLDADAGDRAGRVAGFLGLPPFADDAAPIEGPERFLGRYADAAGSGPDGDALVVAGDARGLHLDDARRTRLIPAHGDQTRFHVAALCVEMRFSDPRTGRFARLELSGPLRDLSPVWLRAEDGP